MAKSLSATMRARLLAYALTLPGAYEDHPWGEVVAKVGKKIFVFLGVEREDGYGVGVKLPESGSVALTLPFVKPSGYGLGKAGWVSAQFAAGERAPLDMLEEWVLESYRSVAPKKLAAQVGSPHATPTKKTAKAKPVKKAAKARPVKKAAKAKPAKKR
jgi:predicted DNA-binding protein (MmcQ/YjbR family)